jgi:hypothetical protein
MALDLASVDLLCRGLLSRVTILFYLYFSAHFEVHFVFVV